MKNTIVFTLAHTHALSTRYLHTNLTKYAQDLYEENDTVFVLVLFV